MAENSTAYDGMSALPNKLLQKDGSTTDMKGNPVVNSVDVYKSKRAIPNKFLNPDGSYSTLNEIIGGSIGSDIFIIVEELPQKGEPNKIYLLVEGDKFIEYIWINNKWDPVGMVEFDITNYYNKEEVRQLIATSLNEAKSYTDQAIQSSILQVLGGSY